MAVESRSPPAASPWDMDKAQPQPTRQDSDPWGSMTGAARSSDDRASGARKQVGVKPLLDSLNASYIHHALGQLNPH